MYQPCNVHDTGAYLMHGQGRPKPANDYNSPALLALGAMQGPPERPGATGDMGLDACLAPRAQI